MRLIPICFAFHTRLLQFNFKYNFFVYWILCLRMCVRSKTRTAVLEQRKNIKIIFKLFFYIVSVNFYCTLAFSAFYFHKTYTKNVGWFNLKSLLCIFIQFTQQRVVVILKLFLFVSIVLQRYYN